MSVFWMATAGLASYTVVVLFLVWLDKDDDE